MSLDITGLLTSVRLIPGRSNLIEFFVHANAMGGEFSCDPANMTFDGEPLPLHDSFSGKIWERNWTARLIGVVDSQGGIGVRPCERVELTTKED